MKRIIALLFILPVFLCSCEFVAGERIVGNGNIVNQSRPVTGFSGIDVSGALEVYVTQDSVFSVNVETDSNIQEFIEVFKDGETLVIRPRKNTNIRASEKNVKVYVKAPVYTHFEASGACDIYGSDTISRSGSIDIDLTGASTIDLAIDAPAIKVYSSGASTVKLKGVTKDLTAHGSGSNDLNCFNLLAETVNVTISGAGHADVYASVRLDATASGAASINYRGDADVKSNTSGAASIERK